jgi:DNA-binding NarL/FixJ family response regulator
MTVDEVTQRHTKRIRIILADDHHVVRSGIRSALERHSDIEIIGEATDGQQALQMAQLLRPDVLLLDINMPGLQGTDVVQKISDIVIDTNEQGDGAGPWPPHILILSAYCEPEYVYNLFAAGAKGYLLKDESAERIVAGIRQVTKGEPALSLPVQKLLLTRRDEPKHSLSQRELEVLRLMAKGYTNDEIAETLVIAVGTVKNHVMNTYKKLPNVRTRSEAVAWAWENRIVEIE